MLHFVAPGVWQIAFPWTNAWLLARGGEAVLVDSGTRWDRKVLVRALDEACPGGFNLRAVLLTHAHCDHAGNAAFLARTYGAEILCHHREEPFIATRRTYIPRGIRGVSRSGLLFAGGEIVFPVERRRPDRLISEADTVETPVGHLIALETSGHTPGHVSYFHEQEGWLFSGDALINVIPWIRKTGLSLPIRVFTWDQQATVRSAWRIADLGPRALFSGHGRPLNPHAPESIRNFMAGIGREPGPEGLSQSRRQ